MLTARELPTGTVTLLFTDVEGSTRMLQDLGREPYVRALTEHRRLLRDGFSSHGGIEVEMQGDSFLFAFPFARQAVAGAVAAQRALREHEWETRPIRVRIGIHTGEPMQADGLYAGLDVHRAARVMSVASGTQVLISARTADLVEGELPDGVALRDVGEFQLKDFAAPQQLYALEIEGQPPESTPVTFDGTRRPSLTVGRRMRRLVMAVAVIAVVVALAVTYLVTRSPAEAMTAPPNSVAVVDPVRNAVVSVISVGTTPTTIVSGGGAVWTLNAGDQTISQVDARTRERARTFSAGANASDIAFAGGAVWVADAAADVVLVLDERGAVQEKIGLGLRHAVQRASSPRVALASRRGEVWATGGDRLAAVVIGSVSRRVLRRTAGFSGASGDATPVGPDLATGDSGVWATDGSDELFRLDEPPGERIQLGGFDGDDGITGVAVDRRYIWAAGAGAVWQVRPTPARPTKTYSVGAGPTGIAIGDGSVWTANALDGTVTRIDLDSGQTTTIAVGGTPGDLTVANGLIWITID